VVRSATEADVDLLVAWHLDPEVSRYWDDETFTRDQMLERLERNDVDAYIVQESGEPVGYLQAWFEPDSHEPAGLDMFLIPSARGRGLGPDAARILARWLTTAGGFRRLIVDPFLSNPVAIRGWRKTGFEPVEERPADEGHKQPWLLMVLEAQTTSVRIASEEDVAPVLALEGVSGRPDEIRSAIAERRCLVAYANDEIAGFCVGGRFFGFDFLELLIVGPNRRRAGIGATLVLDWEGRATTSKLFTSTNLSNVAMQRLFERLGYARSGTVENLDEGDPEIFYFKPNPHLRT
jgi:aminoglycoside 6'-N-acetyltransferase